MFCVSSPNCRVFAQVIHTLAKIGDDVLFEPRDNSLVLKTKNMAESSYAEIEFQSNFFSSFSFNPALYQEDATNFKIAMRSLVSVVKSPHSFDKNVETCLLKYESGKYQLIVTINYSKGTTKEYIIPHIEYESFEANFSKSDAKNFILSDACTLISATNQFKSGEDEITLSSGKENSVLENHLQNAKDCKTTVKTTVRVDHQYLETYAINFPTKITFCLKEFKALLALSENVRLPIGFYFDSPGKPLILEVSEPNVFRINVLISTLQATQSDQQSPSQTAPENVASTSSNCNQNNLGSQTSAQDSTRSRTTYVPESHAGPSNQTSFRTSQDNPTLSLRQVGNTSQSSQNRTTNNSSQPLPNRTQGCYMHNGSQQNEEERTQNDPPVVSQNFVDNERFNSQDQSQRSARSNTQQNVENLTPNDFARSEGRYSQNNSQSVPFKRKTPAEVSARTTSTGRSKRQYFDDDDFDVEAFVLRKNTNGESEAVNSINECVSELAPKEPRNPAVERLYSIVFERCFNSIENQKVSRPKILVYNSDGASDSD